MHNSEQRPWQGAATIPAAATPHLDVQLIMQVQHSLEELVLVANDAFCTGAMPGPLMVPECLIIA